MSYSNGKLEQLTFKKVHCVSPNRFVFRSLDPGNYIGLFQIIKEDRVYNIDIYPLKLKKGNNIITEELNLGYSSLPQK